MKLLACITTIALVCMVLYRCRLCTALGAHPAHYWPSEYDRWALAQAHCDEHLRCMRCEGFV